MKRSTASDARPHAVFVDGGGTKINIWAEDKKGRLLKQTLLPSDPKKSDGRIKKFIRALSAKPEHAWIGFRGVWTFPERQALKQRFSWAARHVNAISDIELAYQRRFQGKEGIVLNAGTGSIAYGQDENGKGARAGGFGPLIGDEGSAFWIGREALKARQTAGNEFMEIRKIVIKGDAVRRIAGLAKKVLTSSSPESRRIREEAGEYLRELVERVRRELNLRKPVALALEGGLFRNKKFRADFVRKLRGYLPLP